MVRSSQKFVPPARRKEPTRAPEYRCLYTDTAESIFSSTPELVNPTRSDIQSSGASPQIRREFVKDKVPIVRAQRRVSEPASTFPVSMSAGLKPVKKTLTIRGGKRKTGERVQKMTSDLDHVIPAVQGHLKDAGSSSNDCASIFNFTQSPPPKRKGMTATARKKIYLDVLLTIYKMRNQLQVLRERRQSLTEKRQRTKPLEIQEEE